MFFKEKPCYVLTFANSESEIEMEPKTNSIQYYRLFEEGGSIREIIDWSLENK